MAKTKTQKAKIIKTSEGDLKDSKFLVFADFQGVSNEDIKSFRRTLRDIGAKFSVVKKRLMGIVLKGAGIALDPHEFPGQAGAIFAKGDISEVAQAAYRFSKAKEGFKILGGADIAKKEPMAQEFVIAIGRLPSREILLAQVLGGITGPMRKFMVALNEVAKKKAVTA